MIVNSNFKGTGCLADLTVAFPVAVSVTDRWDDSVRWYIVHNSARKHLASDSLYNPSQACPKYADLEYVPRPRFSV